MIEPHRLPREKRSLARGAAAGRKVRLAGGGATEATIANIRAAFDRSAVINGHKERVEKCLRLGLAHPRVQARFAAQLHVIQRGSLDLDHACMYVQAAFAFERDALEVAQRNGSRIRLPSMALDELRLILRVLRFKHRHRLFDDTMRAIAAGGDVPLFAEPVR